MSTLVCFGLGYSAEHFVGTFGDGFERIIGTVRGAERAAVLNTHLAGRLKALVFAGAAASHAQGAIMFSSGVNANVRATVKSVAAGTALNLVYPLPLAPAAGDSFTVYAGCDHTQNTCAARFSNLANFRGFPYVPPPQMAY